MIGFWQIAIIVVIVVLIFGPSRLEKLGPSLGKAIRGFKDGINGKEDKELDKADPKKIAQVDVVEDEKKS
jgi:sec-independent protein translocase protein TatA